MKPIGTTGRDRSGRGRTPTARRGVSGPGAAAVDRIEMPMD